MWDATKAVSRRKSIALNTILENEKGLRTITLVVTTLRKTTESKLKAK